MKKLVSFGVLLVFSFLMAGHFVAYEVILHDNKEAMVQNIKSGAHSIELETIVLTNSEAITLIEDDEITYKNHRYDIVDMATTGESTIVHALNDALEERLITGFDEAYQNFNPKTSQGHKNPFNLLIDFFKEYTPGCQATIVSNPIIYLHPFQLQLLSDRILKGHYHRLAQPPKHSIA